MSDPYQSNAPSVAVDPAPATPAPEPERASDHPVDQDARTALKKLHDDFYALKKQVDAALGN